MKTPEQLLLNKIRKKFNKGTTDFGMLEDGDRILIGLSGGKDSLCLLQFLAERSRIFKPNISIEALHVRMETYSTRVMRHILRSLHARMASLCTSSPPASMRKDSATSLPASSVHGIAAKPSSVSPSTMASTR